MSEYIEIKLIKHNGPTTSTDWRKTLTASILVYLVKTPFKDKTQRK